MSQNPAELWSQIHAAMEQEQYEAVIQLLAVFAQLVPQNHHKNTLLLAAARCGLGDVNAALSIFQEEIAVRKSWYSRKDIEVDYAKEFGPALKSGSLDAILDTFHLMQAQDEKQLSNTPIVTTPPIQHANERFPMFVALHGWGETTDFFKQHWHNEHFDRKYICIYPGSTTLGAPGQPCWSNSDRAHEDIVGVLANQGTIDSVDLSMSIIGGFSQGGGLALEYLLQGKSDFRRCLALCPVIPEISDDEICAAATRNAKVYFVLGGLDKQNVKAVKSFASRLDRHMLEYKLLIDPACHHWFPDSFQEIAESATAFLN